MQIVRNPTKGRGKTYIYVYALHRHTIKTSYSMLKQYMSLICHENQLPAPGRRADREARQFPSRLSRFTSY
jgi:hypothetical protein